MGVVGYVIMREKEGMYGIKRNRRWLGFSNKKMRTVYVVVSHKSERVVK
jgi:hypothetical protein